jgi:hypothetical protein
MTLPEKALERKIMTIVKKDSGTTIKVVSNLRRDDSSISESVARQMVWRLIDRGQLALTADRKLEIPK